MDTNGFLIVKRIDELLKLKGEKRPDLCKILNINTSTISAWSIRGTIPPADILQQIADYLETDIRYLLTGETKKPDPDYETANFIQLYSNLDESDKMALRKVADIFAEKNKLSSAIKNNN